MSFSAHDMDPLDRVKADAEKVITKTGDSHVRLIDDARPGLEDIVAGRTQDADQALAALQKRRG